MLARYRPTLSSSCPSVRLFICPSQAGIIPMTKRRIMETMHAIAQGVGLYVFWHQRYREIPLALSDFNGDSKYRLGM